MCRQMYSVLYIRLELFYCVQNAENWSSSLGIPTPVLQNLTATYCTLKNVEGCISFAISAVPFSACYRQEATSYCFGWHGCIFIPDERIIKFASTWENYWQHGRHPKTRWAIIYWCRCYNGSLHLGSSDRWWACILRRMCFERTKYFWSSLQLCYHRHLPGIIFPCSSYYVVLPLLPWQHIWYYSCEGKYNFFQQDRYRFPTFLSKLKQPTPHFLFLKSRMSALQSNCPKITHLFLRNSYSIGGIGSTSQKRI